MNYDPLITSLAPCDAGCPASPPSPRHPVSLRLSPQLPGILGPAVPQYPANLLLINTYMAHEMRWSFSNNLLLFGEKYLQLSDWRNRVTHQYPLSESIKWTFLLWLEQVCSDSSQIEQKHDPLSNFFTKHTCGVEDKIKNIQLKKWSVARLIGLSWGDALWILFSISQARQLSGLLRKIICILLAVLILLLAIYKHLIPPTTGFFNCNDPTIWLPYKGDTFSTKILISVVFLSFFVFVSNNYEYNEL